MTGFRPGRTDGLKKGVRDSGQQAGPGVKGVRDSGQQAGPGVKGGERLRPASWTRCKMEYSVYDIVSQIYFSERHNGDQKIRYRDSAVDYS